jgi:hypothetical protein
MPSRDQLRAPCRYSWTRGRRFVVIHIALSPTATANKLRDTLWGLTKRLRQLDH